MSGNPQNNPANKTNIRRNKGFSAPDLSAVFPTAAVLVLLTAVLMAGYAIWIGYRTRIMDNQKQQLLLTSRTLANNMEMSLEELQRDLIFLCRQQEKAGDFEHAVPLFREYLEAKSLPAAVVADPAAADEAGAPAVVPAPGLETDIFLFSSGSSHSVLGTEIIKEQMVTRVSEDLTIWLCEDEAGRHLYLFRQKISGKEELGLAVDADCFYEKWISGVHIGTSGYIMVKNSSGIILMHPQAFQWGIHVISGRKEWYPELDLDSLEQMVKKQNTGKEGISEYYSYWWMEEPLTRVRKISGYAPARIGEDFWVISAVVDYDDFSAPIENGFARVSALYMGSLLAAVLLVLYVNRLLAARRRSEREIASLREMNERLEIIHRGEERIGHQQRLQVIGTMTGGIAHEFNNLLTPIMGYSELLMLELPEDSEAYESALEIYDASEKAREVVRQISTLSRRNVETVFKKEQALALLRSSVKMMASICPANVRLEEDFAFGEESAILCSATQISQVLLNLFVNALHAVEEKQSSNPVEGRIRIIGRIISRQSLRSIRQLKSQDISGDWDRYLHIRVADNGCGMTRDVLNQIFTPFFTTKKTGEGTGLGLVLAEQIILSHRGYICADSFSGRGSVFSVFLPVLNMDTPEPEPSLASSVPVSRIVIADDNAKILDLLRRSLEKQGLDVYVCRTYSELKTLLEEHAADVLLIDESLEDGSGIDFCMSCQGKYPSMLKIVMADYPTHFLLEARQHSIIDGYLLKPVTDTDALEEIRRCSASRGR